MKQRRNFLQTIAEAAELHGEPLPRLPIIELAGDRRVLIENHRGVTEYSREIIRVQVGYGQVCICGGGLELARMTKEQLVISGRVDSVSLCRRKG